MDRMKKWLIYVLGIVTGIVLTFGVAFCIRMSNNSGIIGLELFEDPGDCMEYSQFEVFQVIDAGCALATADDSFGSIVFIIPDESQQFYDNQKIVLENNQCALRVGTYKYKTNVGFERTVPAIKIIDDAELPKLNRNKEAKNVSGKTLFDKPGECVSRNNFEVLEVLDSGDAVALEVSETMPDYVFTSDLKVLILADEGSNFYNKQIVKAPKGKCARQIGTYKYHSEVIPIIAFK